MTAASSNTRTVRSARPLARALLLAVAAAALLAALTVSADIKLLDLDPYRGTGTTGDAYRAGFMAAFDGKTVGSDSIVFLPRNADEELADLDAILTRVLSENPDVLAVTGAIGVDPVDIMMNSTTASTNHLVALGAYTTSPSYFTFSRNIYMYQFDAFSKIFALIHLALKSEQVQTHTIFYHVDYSILSFVVSACESLLVEAGQGFDVVYAQASDTALDPVQLEATLAARPQVIYIYAEPTNNLKEFMLAVLRDERTATAQFFATETLQDFLTAFVLELKSQYGIELAEDQIILSASTATSSDTQFPHVQLFHQEMKAYIDAGSSTAFTDSTILDTDPTTATNMLAGWVAGTAIYATLKTTITNQGRDVFQDNLFAQRRITIGDALFFGTFADVCTDMSEMMQWACSCNLGGRIAYFRQVNAQGNVVSTSKATTHFAYPPDQCGTFSKVTRLSYANIVTFNFTESSVPQLEFVTDTFYEFYQTLSATALAAANLVVIPTTTATMQADYDAYFEAHKVDFIVGVVPNTAFDSHGAALFNPIRQRPVIEAVDDTLLILAPTAEQQIFLFYTFLDSSSDAEVHRPISSKDVTVVVKDVAQSQVDQYKDFFSKSAATIDVKDPTVRAIDSATAVTSALASSGYNYVIGISFDDAEPIANYLEQNTGAAVVLLYDDFATYYTELMEVLSVKDASVQARLLSMTVLPLWSDTSAAAESESTLLAAFHKIEVSAQQHTPRQLALYVTSVALADFINAVSGSVINATTILTRLYRDTYRYADDLRLGPFTTCNASSEFAIGSGSDCQSRNFGAFELSILSAQRALDPTQPANMASTEPSLAYTARPKRLSKGALAGIIVAAVAAAAIITAVIIVVCCCMKKNARDNKNAPTDPNEPVTIIFTDIESSTALWAHIPTIMPDAVAKHHSVIRGVIAARKCYEVKTIGDSFMIACKDANTAAELAAAIQIALLEADYGTTEIDDAYREMELQREADDEEQLYKAHTAHLPEDAYASMWSGLRVRVGIHTGTCDVRYDDVSKGYDYYGETVNMAARTEAIGNGGQVILTEATWAALTDDTRADLHHTALGPVGLRGVPHAVHMFQVDAVAGRKFAPLRTEIEAVLPDEATEITSSAMATTTSMNVAGVLVSNVIKTILSPFRPLQRSKELKPMLTQWGLSAPAKPPSVSVDDYNTFLTNRLAVKVSAVYQRAHGRTLANGNVSVNTLNSTGTGGLVQIAVNQLTSRRNTEDPAVDRANVSLPRVFVDDVNGSVHDVRRGSRSHSRSFMHRLARRISGRENSAMDSDRVMHFSPGGNNRSSRMGAVTFVSDYSAASTVDVHPVRAPVGKHVEGIDNDSGDALYEVPGSVEMPEKKAQPEVASYVAVPMRDASPFAAKPKLTGWLSPSHPLSADVTPVATPCKTAKSDSPANKTQSKKGQ